MKYTATLHPSLSAKGFGYVTINKIQHGREIYIGHAKWNGYQIYDYESVYGENVPRWALRGLDEQCKEQAARKEPNEKCWHDA